MDATHHTILIAGLLCLAAIGAGLAAARLGTPVLLAFIGVGVLAGEDGPGGIRFDDVGTAYLVGSVALAVILFDGGLQTPPATLRRALAPAGLLATLGVAISAAVMGTAGHAILNLASPEALLLGAATAPTDAAAVAVLLRLSGARVPGRVVAALEVESGLNDPMSVFLTLALVDRVLHPGMASLPHLSGLFALEMGGGAALGLAAGMALLWVFRREQRAPLFAVLGVGSALTVFGAAQSLGASGFLAVYLAGVVLAREQGAGSEAIARFFAALAWLAQITLFLMLGLLVTPHELLPVLLPALALTAVLIVLARPVGVALCLLPLGWGVRETGFVAWVGLRGAVPIYLTTVPLLAGVASGPVLFDVVFVAVIASVAIQGTTIARAARLLRLPAS